MIHQLTFLSRRVGTGRDRGTPRRASSTTRVIPLRPDCNASAIAPKRVLHGAGQSVGEQAGEFRGILQRTALREQSCAIKQFGGLSQ